MFRSIGCYVATDLLHRGGASVIYRARKEDSSDTVILKCLLQENPSPDEVSWFLQEHETTRTLQMEGVTKLLGLEWDGQRPFMVLEDIGGQSLNQWARIADFSCDEVMGLAIRIMQVLGRIHDRNAIHKDINPSNIILDRASGRLELIDFGTSTVLRKETPGFTELGAIQGTLEYIAPEQTGRMNRPIDYRSDYYSLGVTLYEMVTGALPFSGVNPIEIVHSHLAATPTPPAEVNRDVPPIVSEIILTLMSKEPEDRYLSAAGLIHDIQHYFNMEETKGSTSGYHLREGDVFNRLEFGNRLYGRDAEMAKLTQAFQRSRERREGIEAVLVRGYPGIGKSSLVREIEKTVTLENGHFVAGKFDQYRQDTPYSAITSALRQLIRLALSEGEVQVAAWRARVTSAIGGNAGVLVDILPELEGILDDQGRVADQKPDDAQHHNNLMLIELLGTLSSDERPIVMFLDDCQWADAASLSFLNLFLATSDIDNLLVVFAIRSKDAEADHRFMSMIGDLRDKGIHAPVIDLLPLLVSDVAAMLSDAFGTGTEEVLDLAILLRRVTAGNPFLINQLVSKLCRDKHIHYHSGERRWHWDIDRISSQEMAENAVELMVAEINGGDQETGTALKIAACIGTSFDLNMLAEISGETYTKMAQKLVSAIENGWIVPLGRQYRPKSTSREELLSDVTIECRFGHDRIRQAIYESIELEDRQDLHWTIGQYLLSRYLSAPGHILDIASHLNRGADAAKLTERSGELLPLNIAAGERAKATGAHAESFDYFRIAAGLCKPEDWRDRPEVARQLFEGAAESAYLTGANEELTGWTQELLDHAENFTHKTTALSLRISAALARGDQKTAVAIAIEALGDLDVELSTAPDQASMDAAVSDVLKALGKRQISDLCDLPLMDDPEHLAVMRIYHSILSATYTNFPDLFVVLTARMVRLTIEHGLSVMSIGGFADFAIVLCGRLGEYELGYQSGRLAIQLVDKLSAREHAAKANFLFNGFVVHWTDHLGKTLEALRDTHRVAVEIGDLQYAALAAFDYGFNLFWLGGDLPRLRKELEHAQRAIARTKQTWVGYLNLMYRQAVEDIASATRIDPSLTGELFDSADMLPRLEASAASNAIVQIRILRLKLNYLFGAYGAAIDEAISAEPHLSGVAGTPAIPGYHFYLALARLAQARDADEAEKQRVLEAIAESRHLLKQWSDRAPMNYRQKHLLVEAEVARLEGNADQALPLFEEAIELARDNNYMMEEALACERAGYCLLAIGRTRPARHFLRDAHEVWLQCGAMAKVRSLEAETNLLAEQSRAQTRDRTQNMITGTDLDLSSVLQASQAISSEIILPRLLKKLMTVLIENAGATHGILLLKDANGWSIEAEARVTASRVEVQHAARRLTEKDATSLPVTIIKKASRERVDLVLQEIEADPEYASDPYLLANEPKSVLCHPIEMRSEVVGMLYLENDLVAGALSKDRLDVLRPLCAQAAISLENAKLHERQVNLTEAANRFVPNQLANVLGRNTLAEVQLGDHAEREMFLVITDIRQFTTLSETMSPKEVFEFINGYLKATDPAFYDNGGIVIKFIGDSQMVAFPETAESAVNAAIAVQAKVAEFSADLEAQGLPAFGIGIGVHVGRSMLGIVGDEQRFQLDVLSDNVNTATGIEKLTRTFDASIIASQAVIERLSDPQKYTTRSLGLSEIKGRRGAIPIHEILDAEPEEKRQLKLRTKPDFEEGISLLNGRKFSQASISFSKVIDVDPGNVAAKHYLKIAALNIVGS